MRRTSSRSSARASVRGTSGRRIGDALKQLLLGRDRQHARAEERFAQRQASASSAPAARRRGTTCAPCRPSPRSIAGVRTGRRSPGTDTVTGCPTSLPRQEGRPRSLHVPEISRGRSGSGPRRARRSPARARAASAPPRVPVQPARHSGHRHERPSMRARGAGQAGEQLRDLVVSAPRRDDGPDDEQQKEAFGVRNRAGGINPADVIMIAITRLAISAVRVRWLARSRNAAKREQVRQHRCHRKYENDGASLQDGAGRHGIQREIGGRGLSLDVRPVRSRSHAPRFAGTRSNPTCARRFAD